MTYYCNLCGKKMMNKSKYNQYKTILQKTPVNSTIRRNIIPNPVFDRINEIMKRFIKI